MSSIMTVIASSENCVPVGGAAGGAGALSGQRHQVPRDW